MVYDMCMHLPSVYEYFLYVLCKFVVPRASMCLCMNACTVIITISDTCEWNLGIEVSGTWFTRMTEIRLLRWMTEIQRFDEIWTEEIRPRVDVAKWENEISQTDG